MHEKFLHYIWQYRLYETQALVTDEKELIEIVEAGMLNSDAGPDFFNAKVKIGDTFWAGNIEIHQKSSDWIKHKHHINKVYDSVILHVVERIDATIYRSNGEKIPQLQLTPLSHVVQKYSELSQNRLWISCADKLSEIDSLFKRSLLTAMLIERLSNKAESIFSLLEKSKNSWEEAFYITLTRNFGFGKNNDAFERLARSLPLTYLGKHKDNLFQIEALLFGQAGLLSSSEKSDDYFLSLKKEYDFLKSKFNLEPIDASAWRLLRLRPSNFPHIRIAQLASLIHQSSKLFSKIIEKPHLEYLHSLFNCNPSEYWETHYLFGEISPSRKKNIGKSAVEIVIINTIVPFLFCYGKSKQKEELQDIALNLLEQLPAEKNSIISNWETVGMKANSAFESQALLQLKKNYCDVKKCLCCRIGHKVLTTKG